MSYTIPYSFLSILSPASSDGSEWLNSNFVAIVNQFALYPLDIIYENIGASFNGLGITIATGSKVFRPIDYNCTILSWTIVGDQSGSITVDVQKSTYANFPSVATIVGGGNSPSLSSAQKNTATISGWTTTSINAGDVLAFVVTGTVTNVTNVTLVLKIQRT